MGNIRKGFQFQSEINQQVEMQCFKRCHRLGGVNETGKEKQYCSIFTEEKEESLFCYIKNKNR